MRLWVPIYAESSKAKKMSFKDPLLRKLYDVIKSRFEQELVSNNFDRKSTSLFQNQGRLAALRKKQTGCVIDQLRRRHGMVGASYTRYGGEVIETADDRCVERGVPCGYIYMEGDKHCIVFVPLPAHLRGGKDWKELGYWVKE
jgi:hypothetical protein